MMETMFFSSLVTVCLLMTKSEITHQFLDETAHVSEIVGATVTMIELIVFTTTSALKINGTYQGLPIVTRCTGELLVEQPSLVG